MSEIRTLGGETLEQVLGLPPKAAAKTSLSVHEMARLQRILEAGEFLSGGEAGALRVLKDRGQLDVAETEVVDALLERHRHQSVFDDRARKLRERITVAERYAAREAEDRAEAPDWQEREAEGRQDAIERTAQVIESENRQKISHKRFMSGALGAAELPPENLVARIRAHEAAGLNDRAIAEKLDEEMVRTWGGGDARWAPMMVRDVLNRALPVELSWDECCKQAEARYRKPADYGAELKELQAELAALEKAGPGPAAAGVDGA
jgi:hypothetical protein